MYENGARDAGNSIQHRRNRADLRGAWVGTDPDQTLWVFPDEKAVRRAGTDYWKHVRLVEYDTWQNFLEDRKPARDGLFFFEEHGAQSFYAPDYPKDAYLVFGCESKGLPDTVLNGMEDRMFSLPMRSPLVRSLNLANVAAAVVYQAMRPQLFG